MSTISSLVSFLHSLCNTFYASPPDMPLLSHESTLDSYTSSYTYLVVSFYLRIQLQAELELHPLCHLSPAFLQIYTRFFILGKPLFYAAPQPLSFHARFTCWQSFRSLGHQLHQLREKWARHLGESGSVRLESSKMQKRFPSGFEPMVANTRTLTAEQHTLSLQKKPTSKTLKRVSFLHLNFVIIFKQLPKHIDHSQRSQESEKCQDRVL